MSARFNKHYTREEARALLPQLKTWLDNLLRLRQRLDTIEKRLAQAVGFGDDLGGPTVNESVTILADIKDLWREFESREIQIKDLDRGLIDFPAFVGGKEVFLCWEKDEEDIEFWHDLETGFSGRERID
jgi:hypothetical protein